MFEEGEASGALSGWERPLAFAVSATGSFVRAVNWKLRLRKPPADETAAKEGRLVHRMIFLTRFDGSELVVNCDLIVTIEKTPDTVITLTTGQRIMVREDVAEVVNRATSYRHRVLQGPGGGGDLRDIIKDA